MSQKKLPNRQAAIIEEKKITTYLLNLNHDDGKSKAKFFLERGFTLEQWQLFADSLREHASNNEIAKIIPSPFGQKFIIECHLSTPDEINPCIRVVWIMEEDSTQPRLATAYPHL
ncbi:MAG: DUF6883 domain-containing protein [Cyanobacteria bacterium P01_D01_bin.6]